MQVVVQPDAWDDVRDIAAYIARDNIGASLRFIDAIESTFALLSTTPGAGPRVEPEPPRIPGARFWPITGFESYLTLYQPGPDVLVVLRVVHGRRDWRGLLR